nr:MAG: hypothetical protein [Bacteriophage sp.]
MPYLITIKIHIVDLDTDHLNSRVDDPCVDGDLIVTSDLLECLAYSQGILIDGAVVRSGQTHSDKLIIVHFLFSHIGTQSLADIDVREQVVFF